MKANFLTASMLAAAVLIPYGSAATGSRASPRAVLVELFTSEGCSSCPPADALLETLDQSNSPDKPQAVVLSEHVDYWNHGGWADPYSSARFSERQSAYANRLHLESVYTPQMVVDGTVEFVGSDRKRANAAIAEAAQTEKATIRLIAIAGGNGRPERIRVEIDPLPDSLQSHDAEVYFAVAANEASSQVLHGENGGRRLHHVAVVRSLTPIGGIQAGAPFTKEVSLGAAGTNISQYRIVAFVQERGQGRVLGVAMR